MAEEKKEVALTFSESLTKDLVAVQDALPQNFNKTRFVQNAIALLNENSQLQKFANDNKNGVAQIRANMLKAAYLGLDFINKEAYLIPYGSTLTFMKSYIGAVKLCRKYSTRQIKDIYAKLVREGDEYEINIIDNVPKVTFKPKPFNNGKVQGGFAIATFKDGGSQYIEMSLEDLEKRRNCSKQKNGVVWQTWTNEMYLKTLLHSLCKYIDLDFDNAEQVKYFGEEMEIETDPQAQVQRDIAENANSQELDIESAVEVDSEGNVIN